MATTHKLIQTQTVTGGAVASITFSSIPQTYTDLRLIGSWRSDGSANTGADAKLKLNGSTTNFSRKSIYSNGSSVSVSSSSDNYLLLIGPSNSTADTFCSFEVYLPGYASSSLVKGISTNSVTENENTNAYMFITTGEWNDTSAVNSITVYDYYGNNIANNSSFSLYGIKKS